MCVWPDKPVPLFSACSWLATHWMTLCNIFKASQDIWTESLLGQLFALNPNLMLFQWNVRVLIIKWGVSLFVSSKGRTYYCTTWTSQLTRYSQDWLVYERSSSNSKLTQTYYHSLIYVRITCSRGGRDVTVDLIQPWLGQPVIRPDAGASTAVGSIIHILKIFCPSSKRGGWAARTLLKSLVGKHTVSQTTMTCTFPFREYATVPVLLHPLQQATQQMSLWSARETCGVMFLLARFWYKSSYLASHFG